MVAALYYLATVRIPASLLADEVGPHGLPTLLALSLALIGVGLGVRAAVARTVAAKLARDTPADDTTANNADDRHEAAPLRALGLLGIGVLYIPVAWLLGYVVALVMLIAAVAVYEGMRPSWRMAAISIAGAVVFWVLFAVVLGVPQPEAIFF